MEKTNKKITQEEAKSLFYAKLYEDFGFYSKKVLKIRTKEGDTKPLVLNDAQIEFERVIKEQLKKTGRNRVIILKGRQQGLSTVVGAYLYHQVSTRKSKKALVVAHEKRASQTLFSMTKRYHDNNKLDHPLKPATKYDSKTEIVFGELDSSYMIATAGGDGIVRGETITHAHLSEVAFWPESSAEDNLAGLLQAVPNTNDTAIFIESTANGVNGPFYRLWQDAVQGKNSFYPLFIPWFWQTEYREKIPANYKFEPTPDEEKLIELHDLDNEQLYWRRLKISDTSLDKFKQEYPCTPDEAFITSGVSVFEPEPLIARLKELKDGPVARKDWVLDQWLDRTNGKLTLYRNVEPGMTYYIGADVSMGNSTGNVESGGDWSVAQVLDAHGRQCAIFRGKPLPDDFAVILKQIGLMFNEAKIAVESNNHGLLTINKLYKDLNYTNVHYQIIDDKQTDIDTDTLGFRTTKKSKLTIINELRSKLKTGEVELYDRVTINELLTYMVKGADKMGAEKNCHDDCVMSLAIANHINEGVWMPIVNQDHWYIENI